MNDKFTDELLDFDVDGEIIAVIRQHRANNATMAREIVTQRAEIKRLRAERDALQTIITNAHAGTLDIIHRALAGYTDDYKYIDTTGTKYTKWRLVNSDIDALFTLPTAPDVTNPVTE